MLGKMSVQLNFSTQREFEMIEYPGRVINVDKMLNTLGGITKVSQVLGGEQKRLELHYHPDNPFNKSVCAERTANTAGLLISVKVRRSKRNPTRPPEYEFHIVGYCQKSFRFDNMCDFQYLPLSESSITPTEERLEFALDKLVPQSATDTDYFKRTDVTLFCLPQVFARSDIMHTNLFRNDTQEDGQHEVLGVLRKSSNDHRATAAFNKIDAFPTRPDPQILKRMKIKYISDEQLHLVRKLFEDCPIWTRIALLYESGLSSDKLKYIIPSLAYYFSSGPWRTLFVRYGYDPRKDFNSRHYQTFDFRLRFRAGVSEFVSKRLDTIKKKQEDPYEMHELRHDINYPYFEENKLPRSRQCILRYCDIRMPKIQEMLEKIPSPMTGAMCNERTGWLPLGFDGQVRQIVSNAIKELLRNHYRKEQIHAELDEVEHTEQEGEEEEGEEEEGEEEYDDSDNSDTSATNDLTENMESVLEDMQIDSDLLD